MGRLVGNLKLFCKDRGRTVCLEQLLSDLRDGTDSGTSFRGESIMWKVLRRGQLYIPGSRAETSQFFHVVSVGMDGGIQALSFRDC